MKPRLVLAILLVACFASSGLAVSPLVTDDADTVEAGKLQVNSDFFVVRTSSVSLYSVSPNPVVGLTPRLELGAIFGYQWRHGPGPSLTTNNADGLTDVIVVPKFRIWQSSDDKLKLSSRIDLKLPAASSSRGLGTGNPDAGLVGILTYKLAKTSFDSNIGYYAIDASRTDVANDRWFVGEAVRHELNKEWNLVGEAYGLLPNTRAGGYANWYFSGGLQWSVSENIVITALLGSAAGHHSPDLTGTFEATLTF